MSTGSQLDEVLSRIHRRLLALEGVVYGTEPKSPPEAQPWDRGKTYPVSSVPRDTGVPISPEAYKTLVGIDEAGAVMDEDAEALGRLADDGGTVHAERLGDLVEAIDKRLSELAGDKTDEPDPVQDKD